MPEPERPASEEPEEPAGEGVPDEDANDEAVTSREAREEAERLGSVPYERLKKEEAP